MKIKSFYTSSPLFEGERFDDDKPVCVFAAPAVQVFVGVSTTYPFERFESDNVQVV